MTSVNSFKSKSTLTVGGKTYTYYSIEQAEKNGLKGAPKYVSDAGFDFESRSGNFQLAPDSLGFDKGAVIPNFSDRFTGAAPDIGAHEAGTPPMVFGVKANYLPPGK